MSPHQAETNRTSALFDDRDIARTEDYGKYLNQFNVIYLDISGFVSAAGREGASLRDIPRMILSAVQKELEYMEADCNGSRKELELISLCEKHGMAFREVKSWYDGYELSGLVSVYNPYSVMNALEEGTCHSFWGKTSAAEGLTDYIKLYFDGLQETVANLIAGAQISVNTTSFQNDLEHFRSRDDVLTLLVHLGYLTWDAPTGTVHIPNEEVRREFLNFLEEDDVGEHWIRLIARSRKLLKDTLAGNEEAVAAALDEIRREQYAPQYYNNEQALRAIIKYAYLSAIGKYVKIEEMPSGKGLADLAFLPVPYSGLPAMVVELKWNKTAGGAISQIHDRHYTAALQPFSGNIVLVGVNYDEKTGEHTCRIEKA